MVLKSLCKILVAFIVVLIFPTNIKAQINFQEVKIEEAEKVLSKGKSPYIIYFAGEWCPSCKMMEETTFKDEKLANRINHNYLAYKVDIDKSFGKDWTKTYAVHTLPTTLFYTPKGELIKRVEKPITASQFLALTTNSQMIKSFVSLKNNVPIKKNSIKENKLLVPSEYMPLKESISLKTKSEKNQLFQQNKKIIGFLNLERPVQNGEQYIVEIGKYQNVRTVERIVQQIQNRLDYPVKVLIEKEGNTLSQIVYLGEFKTQKAAIDANRSLKIIQNKGMIRKF